MKRVLKSDQSNQTTLGGEGDTHTHTEHGCKRKSEGERKSV